MPHHGVKSGGAVFSPDSTYRYRLTRAWERKLSDEPLSCLFVCLNPSTADAQKNDPTVTRCIGFAQSWGYEILTVLNIFALRSTDPTELYLHADPEGPENDEWIIRETPRHDLVVAAWGNHGDHRARGEKVMKLLRDHAPGGVVHVLGLNATAQPKHPLYLPASTEPMQL